MWREWSFLGSGPSYCIVYSPFGVWAAMPSPTAARRTHRRWMAALTPPGTTATVRALAVALRSKAAATGGILVGRADSKLDSVYLIQVTCGV